MILKIPGFLAIVALLLGSCRPAVKTPLVVFAAGSLIRPFGELEKAFEARYPEIDVLPEYHGSIQVIRYATELHEPIDVIATADHALIPVLMYAVNDPLTGRPYANWYMKFATNRLGIAYNPDSRYAGEIDAQNWMEVLARAEARVGIADPRFDASGYRALMVIALAGIQLDRSNLFDSFLSGQFRFPIEIDTAPGMAIVRVPEVLESATDAHIVIRGSSVQLLALLESGDLDYAFEYESVIQQHGLRQISLPDTLNLGLEANNPDYAAVSVRLDFQRFASVKPEFTGEQIGYGITIPTNALHPREAELFLTFFLGAEGRQIMENNFHPIFPTVHADGYENLPDGLKSMTVPAP